MVLKEILKELADNNTPVLLADNSGEWQAEELLERLSEPMLKRQAHLQPGLYIAEINNGGYLGTVLFKVKDIQ